jgi:tetratricopeptide (TPR) repeat protein
LADIESLLRDGIAAVKRGDRTTARKLLAQVIEQDPKNEKAWMWLATTSNNADERRKLLLKVLEINPNNQRAQQAMASLAMQAPKPIAPDPVVPPQPEPISRERQPKVEAEPIAPPRQTAKPRPEPQDDLTNTTGNKTKKASFNVRGLILAVLALVLIGALIFFGLTLKELLDKQNAPLSVAGANTEVPAPTFTLPPMPTETHTPAPQVEVTVFVPTLPPTYTLTPLPTATPEPTATPTPVPQSEFTLLFVLLEDNANEPALYSMLGDGTNVQRLQEDIRDIAFDPTGTQVAFVRDTPSTNISGEEVLLPQLFIAPFDDLSQATPITSLLGTILGQPSWSPEAKEIVFTSNHESEVEDIWVINVETRHAYRLTDRERNARQPAWRPILGSREVVYTYEGSVGLEINKLEVREEGEDYQIRRLTNQPNSYAPSWNANGQRITFLSDRQVDADVYHMDADGGDQRLVTRDDDGAEDRSPHFTPNGAYIAFVSTRLDGRFNIYLITPDGNTLTRLTDYQDADVIQLIYRPELFFRLSN